MSGETLVRTYRISGLDRILYEAEPVWPEGTFRQDDVEAGRLILRKDGVESPAQLAEAIAWADLVAERFRLAISYRTGCSVKRKLEDSVGPHFDTDGATTLDDRMAISDRAVATMYPRSPPPEIERLHEDSTRWVSTLSEVREFSGYQDEALKRLYLIIEELAPAYGHLLDEADCQKRTEIKYLRDFVSHPKCDRNRDLCDFIAANLPSAVVSNDPLWVSFDRTNIEHRNFIGRHQPDAERIVHTLLRAAIPSL